MYSGGGKEGGRKEVKGKRIEAEAEAGSGKKTTEAKIIVRFHSVGASAAKREIPRKWSKSLLALSEKYTSP